MSSDYTELYKNLEIQIKKISSIHSYLNEKVTKTRLLLTSLRKNLIHRFQIVQTTAARLITRSKKGAYISPILHHLYYWLQVEKKRIIYKL